MNPIRKYNRVSYTFKCLNILMEEGYLTQEEYRELVWTSNKHYWFPTLSTHFTEYPSDHQ